MGDPANTPNVETVQWLLGMDDPSVRYYTMKYLTSEDDVELATAKKAIMQEAIDLVVSKKDGQGRWTLENTFNGRSVVRVERVSEPSKWITLYALKILQSYYG